MQITILYRTWRSVQYTAAQQEKKKIVVSNMSCSQKITSYFTKETITDEDKPIPAEEGLFAFHTIKHNHSFRCVDCTSSVIRNLHAQKCSCDRTKCEAIVVNVLAPFAMQQILEELETVKYICYGGYFKS
jgi:hypothetical protein